MDAFTFTSITARIQNSFSFSFTLFIGKLFHVFNNLIVMVYKYLAFPGTQRHPTCCCSHLHWRSSEGRAEESECQELFSRQRVKLRRTWQGKIWVSFASWKYCADSQIWTFLCAVEKQNWCAGSSVWAGVSRSCSGGECPVPPAGSVLQKQRAQEERAILIGNILALVKHLVCKSWFHDFFWLYIVFHFDFTPSIQICQLVTACAIIHNPGMTDL